MVNLIETLGELNIADDAYITLFYTDRASVWHITDDYINEALADTNTAAMLASLLANKCLTVFSRWEENVLDDMRANGLLADYDREEWFEEYLTETIQQEAYEYDLLSISTEKHDHKRGTCEITAVAKIPVKDVRALGDETAALFSGWSVAIQTKSGVLTLDG